MGCIAGSPTLTDEELDFVAKNTAQSREQINRQYQYFRQKKPGARVTKWDFRDKNNVHQILNSRRSPIIDTITGSHYCGESKDHNIL